MAVTINSDALVTLDETKTWCKVGALDTTYNDLLSMLINAVSTFLINRIGRGVKSADYTQKMVWEGGNLIVLKNYPVSTITSVKVDDETITDYVSLTDQGLIYVNDEIEKGSTVEINYTAGYSTVPDDLKVACLELIKTRFDRWLKGAEDYTSVSANGITINLDDKENWMISDIVKRYGWR